MMHRGCIQALSSKPSDAITMVAAGVAAWQSSGSVVFLPWYVSHLARACAELGQFDEAERHINQAFNAIETTGERWCESDIHCTAGDIALLAPEPNVKRAEAHFTRALATARGQQAKSWELRAATSLARLWHDRGERDKARELLAPIYGWFGEGHQTLDLKRAKGLLEELA